MNIFFEFSPKRTNHLCVFLHSNHFRRTTYVYLFSRSRSSPDTVISSHLCFHLNTHRVTILGISSRLLPSMGTDIEVSGFLKGYINLTSTRNINYKIYITDSLPISLRMKIPNPIHCNTCGPVENRTQTWGLQSPRANRYHYRPNWKTFWYKSVNCIYRRWLCLYNKILFSSYKSFTKFVPDGLFFVPNLFIYIFYSKKFYSKRLLFESLTNPIWADGGIRTPDPLITNQLLWPTELHRHF